MHRNATVLLTALLLVTTGCLEETPSPVDIDPALSQTASGPQGAASYEVTVTNLTAGQPFTPPLAVTHRKALDVFENGEAAGSGVQQIAENGNLPPLHAALVSNKHAADVVIAAGSPPPILPGTTRTFEISAQTGAKYLSFVAMLICTNDGFTGLDAVRLPRDIGQTDQYDAMAYDAGTEVNTEDFADLVPPCAPLTGVPSSEPGTGMSNPLLAEGGVIALHPGIVGSDDLDPALHGWSGAVAHVSITRIN